jgi:lipid-A-disaccharide synthase
MRIFLSTGEVSGDLQGEMLINALQRQATARGIKLEIVALGGDRMKDAGATILDNTTTMGSVGFVEALPFLLPTIQIQNRAKQYLRANPPDVLVLIDYPAPNIAIASYVKKYLPQVPIVYYIAPQDWAVPMLGNAKKITKIIDKLLAIFPEEANYYQEQGINVTWVGHPLLDRIKTAPNKTNARIALGIEPDLPVITLLPASRPQEIKYLLPIILEAAKIIQQQLPEVKFLIPFSLDIYRQAIEKAVKDYNLPAIILSGNTLDAIAAADLAITKSGTVNLEIALLNIPQVVIYRVHPVTAWVARNLLKFSIPLMSPPNLIVNREIVPELQQEKVTAENISQKALELWINKGQKENIRAGYQEMRSYLGEIGVCDRAAAEILNIAQS